MPKTKELRYQPARELRVQTSADGSRTISGTIVYSSLSEDLGGFRELLAPGVFADSMGSDVYCLRQHDPNLVMGRTKSKTLTLTDSPTALRYSCRLPDTEQARSLAAAIDRGDLDATSFGFQTISDDWAVDKDGSVVRTILKADLIEVSPCIFEAYSSSSVSIRSCPDALRGKLKLTKRSNADGCDCDCSACEDGDCDRCSDEECDDVACAANGCPEQDDEDRSISRSDRNKMHMRLELARRK
ncbi:HK97 family phage prohead protease [Terriglobus aquaticus]|uniref:HK97 family phage prohead protease n=1 Tax=Terriglobus aquaticus TaxID=940139 RepID=A0ABW9KIQ4_9BACT|nr:HK97 family phage prohead protease [Terriglobus aquaticus]